MSGVDVKSLTDAQRAHMCRVWTAKKTLGDDASETEIASLVAELRRDDRRASRHTS